MGGEEPTTALELRSRSLLVTVGRDQSNDIVLDDPSVSRQHAQLRMSATVDQLTVLDLRSSNGTYVDGQRIKRAEAQPDSVIRFGDIAFRLSAGQLGSERQHRPPAQRRSRRRLAVTVVLTALVASAAGVALVYRSRQKSQNPDAVPTPRRSQIERWQDEVERQLRQARTKIQLQDWEGAIAVLTPFLEQEPWNSEARAMMQQARNELVNAQDLKRARSLTAQGEPTSLLSARRILSAVPKISTYHRDATYALNKIDDRLARHYLEQGKGLCSRREHRRCYTTLCRYFRYVSSQIETAEEQDARKSMRAIERHRRHGRGLEKCTAPRYLSPPTLAGGVSDPSAALASRYPAREIRRAMLRYHKGDVDESIKLLRKLGQSAVEDTAEQADELRALVQRARGRYREGFAAFREQRQRETQTLWLDMLKIDAMLMPREVVSFYRHDATERLGAVFYAQGEEHYQKGRFEKAYRSWRRGRQIDANNAQIQAGLFSLEKVAHRLVKEARQLLLEGKKAEAGKRLIRATQIVDGGTLRSEAEQLLSRAR
jgi:tetratricopeptide (TPR) repeat protein